MAGEKEYVLGTDADELARLGFQHRLWSEQAYALWERAGFRPGQTILDVGCGPGFATLDLAQLIGNTGRVIGVDASDRFIGYLKSQITARGMTNVDVRVGDVQKLELPPASVDAAYARWVMCFVPDPDAVVAGVARALKPGGVFTIQDYFNYTAISLAPKSAAFDRVIAAVSKSWKQHGGDDDIVGRLPAILANNGFTVREIKPILRVGRPGDIVWHWPTTFFRNYIPKLVEMGFLTKDDQRAYDEEWETRTRDPNSFFMTPPVWDVVAEKS